MITEALTPRLRPAIPATSCGAPTARPVEWIIADAPVPYPDGARGDEGAGRGDCRGHGRRGGVAAGASAALYGRHLGGRRATCSIRERFPVYEAGRGGQYTYHGPGQRVAYVMLDLRERGPRRALPRAGARGLDDRHARRPSTSTASCATAASASGCGGPDKGCGREDKIAAIGVRVSRWVTLPRHRAQRRARPHAISTASCRAASPTRA